MHGGGRKRRRGGRRGVPRRKALIDVRCPPARVEQQLQTACIAIKGDPGSGTSLTLVRGVEWQPEKSDWVNVRASKQTW